jgi:hypothetical protein
MTIKFEKIDNNITVAENVHIWGRNFHFRIDGRGVNGYRVDVMKPLVPVWEAIDGGNPVSTLKEGKSLIRGWRPE